MHRRKRISTIKFQIYRKELSGRPPSIIARLANGRGSSCVDIGKAWGARKGMLCFNPDSGRAHVMLHPLNLLGYLAYAP